MEIDVRSIEQSYANGIYYEELDTVSNKAKVFDLWEFTNDLNLIGLNTNGFLIFLKENGFCNRISSSGAIILTHVKDGKVKLIGKKDIQIYIRNYIFDINKPLLVYRSKVSAELRTISVNQFRTIYLRQFNNIINDGFLNNLDFDNRNTLKDDKDKAYLPFKNVIVEITKGGIELHSYDKFKDVLIFDSQIIDVDFKYDEDWKISPFVKFIKNISNDDISRKNSIKSAFGYLLHNYNDIANSQAVILYDEKFTDLNTPMGGSGKGIIGQALQAVSKGFVRIDGKGLKLDGQFIFQKVREDTRIIFIDDVSRNFNFERFNSILSEGIDIEKKFRDPIEVSKSNMPKIVIASNIILPNEGTTLSRRQYIIELSEHYSSMLMQGIKQPIIKEHTKRFFSKEWNDKDWNGFYSFIIKCLQYYLSNGLVEPPKLNMKKNRAIQKMGKALYNAFEMMVFDNEIEYSTIKIYNQLIEDGVIDEQTTKRMVTDYLKQYLISEDISYSDIKKQKIIIYRA